MSVITGIIVALSTDMSCAVEVSEWISNFIPHFIMGVITGIIVALSTDMSCIVLFLNISNREMPRRIRSVDIVLNIFARWQQRRLK